MQLTRFNLVGIVNTLLDFGLFFLLSGAGMTYLLAQACSYGCGIVNSYMLNKYWTFGVTGTRVSELFRFVTVNLSALAASVLLVYLFHSPLRLPLVHAKVAATLLTMTISFCGSKFWVFRRSGLTLEQDRER
ncbi:GtrA family protein [Geobacter sp. SVR]|uniref:GtrA family protein n=1 Tax=Geobacter sp. SVR TaxID=2495594 RepID=UPI00195270FD|nr:GtrA family protein [Geobacter sp. SVR]